MQRQEAIKQLMQQNIIVAVGCTEPVAVALCVAKAKETLAQEVETIELQLSKNIIKNAMGVGIPGTGMIGLPIAVAIAVVCGKSDKELEVLYEGKDHLDEAKKWLDSHHIEVKAKDTEEKLYIECICKGKTSTSQAVIAGTHTNFIHIQRDDQIIFHKDLEKKQEGADKDNVLDTITAKEIYDYATTEPLSNISWIWETVTLNDACSEAGLEGKYGLQIGKTLFHDADKSIRKEIIGRTCAASDARMDGITMPIYSNSGSGNQGITCTLPVYHFGQSVGASKETITRALVLSHLMSIYIKSKIGRLSALCGAVNASMGVSAGLVYLSGGSFEQITYAIKNMINTITGIVCDGAKPSCALKISASLNSAFDSLDLAMKNIVVDTTDGISEKDIDRSINSMGNIGRYAMDETDNMILEIMTHKQ